MTKLLQRLAPAMVALCLPFEVGAQARGADPADARASAPALRYGSAFADYLPWEDLKRGDWRAANENVRDAAGRGNAHPGHSRTAPPSPRGALPGPAPARSPQDASGHGEHPMQGGQHPLHGGER